METDKVVKKQHMELGIFFLFVSVQFTVPGADRKYVVRLQWAVR
jgi:hypothetical protein